MKVNKRDSQAILNSLAGGVVPSRGLQHILIGRTAEANQIMKDLQEVKEGSAKVKFFIGAFGSGKSFIQGLIQQIGFKEKFVVAKADFTPERRLYGNERKAVATYTELVKNIAVSSKPEGNALKIILEKWIGDVLSKVVQEKGYDNVDFQNEQFVKDVKTEMNELISAMDNLTGGYDFALVISSYFEGYVNDDEELQRKALKWIRGEYTTKTEARKDLGVRTIIDDLNYYEYIKVLANFIRSIGYSGLIINLDEAINLYKITHPQTREKNYETILKIFNDTLQGSLEGIYITFGGTPEFLEDERRGLFSYQALKRRLVSNKFETADFRDMSQPVIKLAPLDHNEIFVLVTKLKEIHEAHYSYESGITQEDIASFLKKEFEKMGSLEHLTVGSIIRDFLGALNILHQNPQYNKKEIFGGNEVIKQETPTSRFSRFSTLEGE